MKDRPGEDSRERLIEITTAGRELAATRLPGMAGRTAAGKGAALTGIFSRLNV